MEKKIRWGDENVEILIGTNVTKVIFKNRETQAVLGQYEFADALAFNREYCSNVQLRSLVGDSSGQFYKFKTVSRLYAQDYNENNAIHALRYLLTPGVKFNCSVEVAKASKIILLLQEDGIIGLAKYVMSEFKRMNAKDNQNVFGYDEYYDDGIMQHVLEMCECATVDDAMVLGILRDGIVQGFNWRNYEMLKAAGLPELIHKFDNDFRGDIIKVHTIEGIGSVIQTHVSKDKEHAAQYYAGDGKNDHYVYYDMADCIIGMMFPTHADSVSVLYRSEKEN